MSVNCLRASVQKQSRTGFKRQAGLCPFLIPSRFLPVHGVSSTSLCWKPPGYTRKPAGKHRLVSTKCQGITVYPGQAGAGWGYQDRTKEENGGGGPGEGDRDRGLKNYTVTRLVLLSGLILKRLKNI